MVSRAAQRGQAIVFGLLFLGVAVVAMLLVYNHGILTRDRVQLENAADAAVYTQAKLFARNQNFIAYTNRAMIANELSIGQMVAMRSWAKRYKTVPSWINSFPAYQIPIVPPAPRPTLADMLNLVYLPYFAIGTGVDAVSAPLIGFYPTTVSYFNMALSMFQKAFAMATVESQIEGMIDVVEAHESKNNAADPDDDLYIPLLGYYFLTQNAALTYFGDSFSYENLYSQASSAMSSGGGGAAGGGAGGAEPEPSTTDEVVGSFLGGLNGPETMLVDTNPERYKKKPGATQDPPANDDAKEAYRQFAAIINDNRNDWLDQRHYTLGPPPISMPEITLPLGPLKISFSLTLEMGSFNDGGTAYRYNPLRTSSTGDGIERYGWTSIDYTSLGFQLDVDLVIELCLWFPVVGTKCFTLIDGHIPLGFGMPISGATEQLVAEQADAMRSAPQWGFPGMDSTGLAPGMYGDSFHMVHAVSWFWGQVRNIYGTIPADVKTEYAGPPSFFSLNDSFAESGTSHEFSIAVAKKLSDVPTTDSPDGLDLNGSSGNQLYRFQLDTQGPVDGTLSTAYATALWQEPNALMTVSSAETYFASPREGEVASQFSPFWDARLREPSAITMMIASGEIDPFALMEELNLSGGIMGVAEWVIDKAMESLTEPAKEQLLKNVQPPVKALAEEVVDEVLDEVTGAAKDSLMGELEKYVP
ncbi:Tad domain-containing protein [Pseudomonas sp. F(2018)]|uniref:Tad domain-containing protein n=1 Tax=Pseudomonas sp. F(2018) TaxID=2502240 RepID=UPI0010F75F4E|nr:Tad domain-containing protein [Pseudomonas sp. F(2018)]